MVKFFYDVIKLGFEDFCDNSLLGLWIIYDIVLNVLVVSYMWAFGLVV